MRSKRCSVAVIVAKELAQYGSSSAKACSVAVLGQGMLCSMTRLAGAAACSVAMACCFAFLAPAPCLAAPLQKGCWQSYMQRGWRAASVANVAGRLLGKRICDCNLCIGTLLHAQLVHAGRGQPLRSVHDRRDSRSRLPEDSPPFRLGPPQTCSVAIRAL